MKQPVFLVEVESLPDAFKRVSSLIWNNGRRSGPGGSVKEATVTIHVSDPFAEPRYHRLGCYHPHDLEVYRLEVVWGVHDHWIDYTSKDQWRYTYHDRLFNYRGMNQIDKMIQRMITCSESELAAAHQAITWMPKFDLSTNDSPRLQRLCFRWLFDDGVWRLNLSVDWRSMDFLKAWFMNAIAMTDLQRVVAKIVGSCRNVDMRVGQYIDRFDSLYIFESDLEVFSRMGEDGLLLQTSDLTSVFEEARCSLFARLEGEKAGGSRNIAKTKEEKLSYPPIWKY